MDITGSISQNYQYLGEKPVAATSTAEEGDESETSVLTMPEFIDSMTPQELKQFNNNLEQSFNTEMDRDQKRMERGLQAIKESIEG